MNIKTINQRLDAFLTSENISSDAFRKSIGLKAKAQVSNWRTLQEPIPSAHFISIITAYKRLNARWFFTGEGSMIEGESIEGSLQDPKIEYKKCVGCEARDAHIKDLQSHINTLKETIERLNGDDPKKDSANCG